MVSGSHLHASLSLKQAGNLHFLFWQAVKYLNTYDFKVLFVSMDGAQTNRDFMKMFFSASSPLIENFAIKNIWSPHDPQIIFIMDYSHVIKRVRNNVLKSGVGITKTYLYNFDPLKPHFYIVKLGFTGVYIIFLISAQSIDCGYSLEPLRRGGSNEYPHSMFWAEIRKTNLNFYLKIFIFCW